MLRIVQVAPSAKPDEYYSNNHRHVTEFLHPAYPDLRGQNVFLRLHATDHVLGRLHHSTAWLACAMIAGNAWTGFSSSTREPTRINVGRDELLTSSSYYFHVPCSQGNENDSIPYPICPCFRDWTFPHNNLPYHKSNLREFALLTTNSRSHSCSRLQLHASVIAAISSPAVAGGLELPLWCDH